MSELSNNVDLRQSNSYTEQSAPSAEPGQKYTPAPYPAKYEPFSTFMQAARNGDYDAVNLILANRPEFVAGTTAFGTTALHEASTPEVAELLLRSGAYINANNKVGSTPLMRAASTGNAPVVDALLKQGADVMVRDDIGRTALHTANNSFLRQSDGVRGELVSLLLSHGADSTAQDENGVTPIHLVANNLNGDRDAAWALWDLKLAGADATAADRKGATPIEYAVRRENTAAIHNLVSRLDVNPNQVVNETTGDTLMKWPPVLRQMVKTQNPANGELSHGSNTQAVHTGV